MTDPLLWLAIIIVCGGAFAVFMAALKCGSDCDDQQEAIHAKDRAD